ncbi:MULTISPECIES: SDR family oxidoreductase [Mycobacterium]|uniref:Short-chain dehydrogenase n=1 Tax=Mycobacterium kiyosense TaxID=2871094 RepID=A0A9P3QAD6_9MYCO|nr:MULTISPECIES: SDR family oxidoreductase [Mycobacterium]BDB41144.1 short-chain dehydrogenase [Mycobacterium kiyosense]BDE12933.1 short-chain dehydrogenase [Mycobacterium sp. 20KCMC460]GLB83624.1 short-chain dehydrogenase [Mycobacterium kiyosense]GLB91525.1 short-chain dehydrogenase [Mycobacterium kiyosense]GLB97494.1 short-chain dehydrogenase [Mycobacterium kiyosense]
MDVTQLFDLTGKVAVVTGGAGDIGRTYAEALCATGASVVVADINLDAARECADGLVQQGFSAIAVRLDVTSPESAAAMADAAVAAFGGIDILINNAAVMTDLPPFGLSDMPMPDWDRVLNVNLRGPLVCTQAVIESMTRRGGGRVVNGLSAGAFMPGGIYGVSKYALHGLTCNLATELGSRGINVNGIAPGLVASESGYVSLPRDSPFRDILAAQIPGKTSGPPADLVGTMLLLCSPAGEWINGQTISVDGGWIMRL